MSLRRGTPACLLAALALSSVALVVVSSSQAASGPGRAPAARSLAGHHWRHRAQIDGKGRRDAVVIIGGKDLTLDSIGNGIGHVKVRVHLAGSRRILSSRRFLAYLSVRSPWTPWLGATNLDHRGGREIVLGFSTGAHSQFFTVLHDRNGRLRELGAPAGLSWGVNSSVGTGSSGWLCTARGVESRSVFPGAASPTYRIVRNRYVRKAGRWVRTHHVGKTVAADPQGNPPASTDDYPRFICPHLPRNIL